MSIFINKFGLRIGICFMLICINNLLQAVEGRMQGDKKYEQAYKEIFLFINSSSGGGLGKDMIDRKLKELSFEVPKSQYERDLKNIIKVDIHFFNMKESDSRKDGFTRLKNSLGMDKPEPILIICGGDGTVMWVVTEMASYGIDHLRVPIAIIPLGTGNDFSQTLGWGKQSPDLLSNNLQKLKKRVTYWLSAQEGYMDIWMVDAEVQSYGKFQKVENGENKLIQGFAITRHFCNYFSVGVDGKVGYSFDRHRTSTRIGNLAMYGMVGLVKSFTKTKTVGELAVSFKDTVSEKQRESIEVKDTVSKQFNKVIFESGSPGLQTIKDNQNLLAMNINSFMGGIVDVWKNAKSRSHLSGEKFTEQSHSDGKLEFLSFGGVWSLGFEKTSSGNGQKVHQGTGPFQLCFRQYPAQEKHRTYLQIDGQFIRYTHPSRLVIRKSNLSVSGKIRVLRRVPLENNKRCCG